MKALSREQKLGVAADPEMTISAGRLAAAAATVAAQLRGAAFEASAAAAEFSVEASGPAAVPTPAACLCLGALSSRQPAA